MSLFNIDLQTGLSGENKCQKFLETLYPKCDGYIVEKFKDPYAPFDFYVKLNGVVIHEYEVKNRSCAYEQYKSLMFGHSKLIYLLKKLIEYPNRKFTILWLLNDQNFYGWEYINDTNQFKKSLGVNRKRNEIWKDCVYVYNKYIKKLTNN
tara:strand:+ start:428 stop:877 length:450 start_codon:yes stop_codon:yes gene_type:complete